MKKTLFSLIAVVFALPKIALAHCPLCTVGAGALAVLAASLGVSAVVVGLLIGAFALALSLWLAGLVKKNYFRYQKQVLTLILFLGTVIPIMPLVRSYGPFYVSFIGEYGTTYTINLYILGVVIGVLIMWATPFLSRFITQVRDKQIPYQGVSLTIALLIIVSVIIQLLS